MIEHRFTFSQPGYGWGRIYVHDTDEALRADLADSLPEPDPDDQVFAVWLGIIRPRGYYLGALHVPLEASLADVTHEIVHVTCSAWRRTHPTVDLGDTTQFVGKHYDDPEERFAYVLGSYADSIIGALQGIGMLQALPMAD